MRRLRKKLGKPVITASQPGKMRQVEPSRFPEPARSEQEATAPEPFEPSTESLELDETEVGDQTNDVDGADPVPAPPKPPTRPTRRARRSAAAADAADADGETANDDVVRAATVTDEIDEDVDEAQPIDESTSIDEAFPEDEIFREDGSFAEDESAPDDQPVEPLDLTKLPPPNGEPVALGHEPPVPSQLTSPIAEPADRLEPAPIDDVLAAEDTASDPTHEVPARGAHDAGADEATSTTTALGGDDPEARLAARATTPELGQLELRQIAGLTSGITMRLDPERYDFSENSSDGIGFQIEVDYNERALVIPGASEIKVDTIVATDPTLIGAGVLDVGSARFLVRHRREHKRATDWLDQYESIDRPEPLIEVPAGLGLEADAEQAATPSKGRLRRKKKSTAARVATPALNVPSWEFIERVRATRIELTDRERYLHPDPAELADRAAHRAPILGIRPPGHPLFAKVGVLVADMPWMPRFDDISAIPESLGPYMKPLMSLPSLPIAADLMVGPLGIVGSRNATVACARHIMVSLYGLSTSDLHLHVVAGDEHIDSWEWAFDIAPERAIEVGPGFPLVVVDGMENFAASGLNHNDAIDKRAGLVILAESVEDLPAYCGTVLQVDRSGGGLLTNHLGHIIAGTPIGVTTTFASTVADDLYSVMERRHNR